MTPSKIYQFTVPAGGAFALQAIGSYFKVQAATGQVEVRGDTFGTVGVLLPGQGMRGSAFGRLEFRDLSGSANMVTVLIAGSDFVDDRISGSVEIIDGGRTRTMAGEAFTAFGQHQVSVAANRPIVQLWNPPGSGRNAFIKSAIYSSNTAQFVGITPAPVQLGALFGQAKAKSQSKPDGATQVRNVQQAAYPGSPNLFSGYIQANGVLQLTMQEPLMIAPGEGLGVFGADTSLNNLLTVCFELVEEAVL